MARKLCGTAGLPRSWAGQRWAYAQGLRVETQPSGARSTGEGSGALGSPCLSHLGGVTAAGCHPRTLRVGRSECACVRSSQVTLASRATGLEVGRKVVLEAVVDAPT